MQDLCDSAMLSSQLYR